MRVTSSRRPPLSPSPTTGRAHPPGVRLVSTFKYRPLGWHETCQLRSLQCLLLPPTRAPLLATGRESLLYKLLLAGKRPASHQQVSSSLCPREPTVQLPAWLSPSGFIITLPLLNTDLFVGRHETCQLKSLQCLLLPPTRVANPCHRPGELII